MPGSRDKTLEAVYAEPVRANIKWVHIESMLTRHGAEITEGRGSRIRVKLNGVRASFHRPHPRPEASKPIVLSVRDFLIEAGVEP